MRRMRYHENLASLGRLAKQTRQRCKQFGVKAAFRLVQNHQFWRTRREQRSDEQDISECAVGEFCRIQRAEKPMLPHLDLEMFVHL